MNLSAVLRAQRVTRWHGYPEVPAETLGHHHAVTAILCLHLTGGRASSSLLAAALLHDAHEVITGDLPWRVRRDNPDLAAAYAAAAERAEAAMGIDLHLSGSERSILRLADRLAAWLWVAAVSPAALATEDFRQNRSDMIGAAWAIHPDMGARVEGLLA